MTNIRSLDFQLFSAFRAVRAKTIRAVASRELRGLKLGVSEVRALQAHSKAAMTFNGLRVATEMDKGQLSRTLRKMQDKGLVMLSYTDHDRGAVSGMSIRITSKGQRIRAELLRDLGKADRIVLSALSSVERAQFETILRKISGVKAA
jgi:DNA-binding MarR family transcriptional regulator